MKEMTNLHTIPRGGSVKKTVLVVALATVLVLVFAGSAFAEFNRSGQQFLGAAPAPSAIPTQGLDTNVYMSWQDIDELGTNAGDNSPHGNYTTTTVKCVVCHAVHYAAPGEAPADTGLQTADTLLRMKATDSCSFCHATAGMAVNGRPVYDGLNPTPAETGGDKDTGHAIGENCSMCHTSVHAVGADESVASLQGYLLKKQPLDAVGPDAEATDEMIDNITIIENLATFQGFDDGAALNGTPFEYSTVNNATLREQAVGIFCAECHNGAYSTAAAGATTNVKGSSDFAFSGHRIAAEAEATWNVDHAVSSSTFEGAVAWAPATNCKSCHDSLDIYGNDAFPHSWGETKMWLKVAESAGAPHDSLPYGDRCRLGVRRRSPAAL